MEAGHPGLGRFKEASPIDIDQCGQALTGQKLIAARPPHGPTDGHEALEALQHYPVAGSKKGVVPEISLALGPEEVAFFDPAVGVDKAHVPRRGVGAPVSEQL